jgi:hypothetical protein
MRTTNLAYIQILLKAMPNMSFLHKSVRGKFIIEQLLDFLAFLPERYIYNNSMAFSLLANYTDRVDVACR